MFWTSNDQAGAFRAVAGYVAMTIAYFGLTFLFDPNESVGHRLWSTTVWIVLMLGLLELMPRVWRRSRGHRLER